MSEKILDSLASKANMCIEPTTIPSSPLYHMAKVAKFDSQTSYELIQSALDYLSCKAKAEESFSNDEKEFLKEVYEAFYWGGRYKGYPEAARLADHYVNGDGKPIYINSEIYQNSKVVQETQNAIKLFILKKVDSIKFPYKIRSNNAELLQSSFVKKAMSLNYRLEGKMKKGGVLEAAQNDHRLHKADGHFYLDSTTEFKDGTFYTKWSVRSLYDFEAYEKHDYYTNIPLGKYQLKIDDGLSNYMTKIEVAKDFYYNTSWNETWKKQ